jgi:hypothetical protein
MASVNELLRLFMRPAQSEHAMRRQRGVRVTEEKPPQASRRRLAAPRKERVNGSQNQPPL